MMEVMEVIEVLTKSTLLRLGLRSVLGKGVQIRKKGGDFCRKGWCLEGLRKWEFGSWSWVLVGWLVGGS